MYMMPLGTLLSRIRAKWLQPHFLRTINSADLCECRVIHQRTADTRIFMAYPYNALQDYHQRP